MYGEKGAEWGRGRRRHMNKYRIPYLPAVLLDSIQYRPSFGHSLVTFHIADF